MSSIVHNQILLKNQLEAKKKMLKFQKADENQKEISISELKNIKGF